MRYRLKSFQYALEGMKTMLTEEPNAKIHSLITLVVVFAGLFFQISRWEWVAVVLCTGWVFSMELVNTSIERMANFVSPQFHEAIKRIKDLAAAAGLMSAIGSVITGVIIFLPKILELLSGGSDKAFPE